jgi:rRNA maturation protein Nop10
LLVRDAENGYLTADAAVEENENAMNYLLGSSITYRIAIAPQQGRKVFTLQTLPDCGDDPLASSVGKVAGFSLHAGVAARANERDKLERLCRYIARSAVSTQRLSLTRNGQIRYELKTPYNDGTTHVIFEPLDFIARLVALVPRPRVNLTRYHGVFAPHSQYRAWVTPAKRGKGKKGIAAQQQPDQTPAERRAWPRPASRPVPGLTFSMTWAQRLKRVFNIDIETCSACGGDVKIIACIEDPAVIKKILAHLDEKALSASPGRLPECRAPPGAGLFKGV